MLPLSSGGASDAAADETLDEYLHLYMASRGVLITPFRRRRKSRWAKSVS